MFRASISIFVSALMCFAGQGPQAVGLPPMGRFGAHTPQSSVDLSDSTRVESLIRAGNLYLSLSDAIALAVENNLDIELQRSTLDTARTEVLRAQGGGTLRGLLYTLAETPAGVGGPVSPLVTNPASSAQTQSTVATNASQASVLGEPQTNLSVQGTIPMSAGTPVPVFDPALVGALNWTHQTAPQTNPNTYGTNMYVASVANANVGVQQGFASGGQASVFFNNNHESVNSFSSLYSPFTGSSLGIQYTQPLLRGFGPALNHRYIRIARNEQKIGSLLFRQQLIAVVYGVQRLYTDLVALFEDAKVKDQALAAAQKLYSDSKEQVDEGTLAPVELTRAKAAVASRLQDLINARGLLEEQEAILKSVLTRRGVENPSLREARIVPLDSLDVPDRDSLRPIQDLLSDAQANRPDLAQAGLQVENLEIGLQGSRNALLPQVDLVGVMQNNGLTGAVNPLTGNPSVPYVGGFGGVLEQLASRKFPTYGAGIQVTLPLHNRIAEADLVRDELQVRQSRIRSQQLQNQARLEVQDAVIAMRRARGTYEAAVQARLLQKESLEAEQLKFEAGASTSFFVIQYQTLLSQAQSTEIAAKSAYLKAKAALQRATGTILDDNRVSIDTAVRGR